MKALLFPDTVTPILIRTKKRVLSSPESGAEPGWYVTLIISGVGSHLQSDLQAGLVVTSLLPHEHRMSVVNIAVRRHPLSGSIPVKSKSRQINDEREDEK